MTIVAKAVLGAILMSGVVELGQVGAIYVSQTPGRPGALTIEGAVMDSLRGVTSTAAVREGAALNIVLGQGLKGNSEFSIEVDIPDDVKVVTLGTKRAPVWTRESGPVGRVRVGPRPASPAKKVNPPATSGGPAGP
jgi:hypothetical protein